MCGRSILRTGPRHHPALGGDVGLLRRERGRPTADVLDLDLGAWPCAGIHDGSGGREPVRRGGLVDRHVRATSAELVVLDRSNRLIARVAVPEGGPLSGEALAPNGRICSWRRAQAWSCSTLRAISLSLACSTPTRAAPSRWRSRQLPLRRRQRRTSRTGHGIQHRRPIPGRTGPGRPATGRVGVHSGRSRAVRHIGTDLQPCGDRDRPTRRVASHRHQELDRPRHRAGWVRTGPRRRQPHRTNMGNSARQQRRRGVRYQAPQGWRCERSAGMDPGRARPVGVTVADDGKRIVVANSNRFVAPESPSTLSVIVARGPHGKPALTRSVATQGFPRDVTVSPDGNTVITSCYGSGTIDMVSVAS